MSNFPSGRSIVSASVGLACLVSVQAHAEPQAPAPAENVILFVADGASWGGWDLASYWEYGELGQQPYDQFSVKLGMTTEPFGAPPYDPDAAWDVTPTGDADYFEGYKTIKQNATDSAAAGTTLATGRKTTNGRINYDADGNPLPFITQDMKRSGKATGVVSSVDFHHATPAAFGAQAISRGDAYSITNQMINDGLLDLIMGAGHPEYDIDGNLRSEPDFSKIPEDVWDALNGPDAPMTLIETKEDFEALADGTLEVNGRLLGLAPIFDTLQADRNPFTTPIDPNAPGSPNICLDDGSGSTICFDQGHELLSTTPSLETMTKGALNHLGDDEDGLFLMVEGGAIDWMAHSNATGRVIEEQIDFNRAVGAAVDWVEAESSWDETLMIVLTDHGNGMPMGPESDTIPFQPIQNNGAGELPGYLWHSGSHTTENTLFWANGAGSDLFYDHVVGIDEGLRDIIGFNDGRYIGNESVFSVMAEAAGVERVPFASSVWLFVCGLMAFGASRYRSRRATGA